MNTHEFSIVSNGYLVKGFDVGTLKAVTVERLREYCSRRGFYKHVSVGPDWKVKSETWCADATSLNSELVLCRCFG